MVGKVGVLEFANPPTFHPIRMEKRSTVSDHTAIPADGHTMAKFHRHTFELGSIWLEPVFIREDKVPVSTTAQHLLDPHTEALRGIMNIEV
jgi:hypothetical protein